MSENKKLTPKELIKELIEGSEYTLKDSVKGRVRIVGRDKKIINFLPRQFGVESLNDKMSLSPEQIEKIKANFLSILREGAKPVASAGITGEASMEQDLQSATKKSVKSKPKFNLASKNKTLEEIYEGSKTAAAKSQSKSAQYFTPVAVRKKNTKIPCKVRISFLRKSCSDEKLGILARVKIPLLMENFGLNDVINSSEHAQMAKKMVRTIANLYVAKDLRGVRIEGPVCLSMGFKSQMADISNHAFVFKLIEDTLVNNRVITDDNASVVKEIKMYKQDEFDGVLVDILKTDR